MMNRESKTKNRPITLSPRHLVILSLPYLIFLLAAVLRLAAFDEALVAGDQSAILSSAFQVAHFRYFPLVGMKSSVGVMQTGIVPLLAAIPLLLVKSVIAVKWFFSVLDLLALAWLYRAARQTLGRRAALITMLLYATNPWVIEFIRTIWFQTLIPTFATVAFAAFMTLLPSSHPKRASSVYTGKAKRARFGNRGYILHHRNNGNALILALVSATLMGMVHLAAMPWTVLLFALGLWLAWRYRLWRGFWIGVGLSFLLVLPYLIYLVQTSFSDVFFLAQAGSKTQALNTNGYRLVGELISGAFVIANTHGRQWDDQVIDWSFGYKIIPIVFVLSLLWVVKKAVSTDLVKSHRNNAIISIGIFAAVWSLLAPALFLFTQTHLQHFYLLHVFPAPFVLIGASIEGLDGLRQYKLESRSRNLVGRPGGLSYIAECLATGMLILLALWWSSLWIVRIHLEAQGQLERYTRAWLMDTTARTVAGYLDREPNGQVIILSEFKGDVSAFDWIRAYVGSDAIRVTPVSAGFIIPNAPTCYMLGPGITTDALTPVAGIITPRPAMTIPANPPWDCYCMSSPGTRPDALANWGNGMQLLDVAIENTLSPGKQLRLSYTWQYTHVAPQEYHIFNHLLHGDTLVAQVDGSGVPTHYWRDGDILLTRFVLQLPEELAPGDYRLLTGSYTWPAQERIFLTNGEAAYTVKEWTVP
ncbi:MAG: hypothetical protein JXA33_08445 [Anaerolineae bacterium]|nr:hypothetical protein [Anaerolineae bacterium]